MRQQKSQNPKNLQYSEFEEILASGKLVNFIAQRNSILGKTYTEIKSLGGAVEARAFGLIEPHSKNSTLAVIKNKGREFFQWFLLRGELNSREHRLQNRSDT